MTENDIRIELGSGGSPSPNFIHCDIDRKNPDLEILLDARLLPFQPESIDMIFASHLIEHLTFKEARDFLTQSFTALRHSAKIVLYAPNLEWAIQHWQNLSIAPNPLDVFYGSQTDSFQIHKSGYSPKTLAGILESIGFLVTCLNCRGNSWFEFGVEAHKP